MAIVTGLTAERMQEIIDATVVDADIIADHLILTLHDGSTIDAGIVKGDTGDPGAPGAPGATGPSGITVCTSGTRPGSPYDGQQIYETDTYKTLIWYAGKGGWFPPWNTAWGIIKKHRLTTNYGPTNLDGNSDMVLSNVSFRNDRHYKLGLTAEGGVSGSGLWAVEFTVNGATVGRGALCQETFFFGEHLHGDLPYTPAVAGTWTCRVYLLEVTGSASFSMSASATIPRQFWVEDIGPAV